MEESGGFDRLNGKSRIMQRTIVKIGHWSSWIAFVGAVGYVLSVPLQIFKLVGPLEDAAIGLGFSLLIPVPFLLALLALHYLAPEEKRFWTHAAIVFGIIYAVYCTLNYVVQLTTVIPAGYFWTFENQQGDSRAAEPSESNSPLPLLGYGGIGKHLLEHRDDIHDSGL
jgi:hypothetical protein